MPCPSGFYCPKGSKHYPGNKKIPCPIGTYALAADSNWEGLHDCKACPQGKYCDQSPTVESDVNDLPECPFGHYCPTGTRSPTQFPCEAGTYLDANGSVASDDCKTCPERKYCLPGTGGETGNGLFAKAILDCNPGFFCPEGSPSGNLNPCPPGFYSSSLRFRNEITCHH